MTIRRERAAASCWSGRAVLVAAVLGLLLSGQGRPAAALGIDVLSSNVTVATRAVAGDKVDDSGVISRPLNALRQSVAVEVQNAGGTSFIFGQDSSFARSHLVVLPGSVRVASAVRVSGRVDPRITGDALAAVTGEFVFSVEPSAVVPMSGQVMLALQNLTPTVKTAELIQGSLSFSFLVENSSTGATLFQSSDPLMLPDTLQLDGVKVGEQVRVRYEATLSTVLMDTRQFAKMKFAPKIFAFPPVPVPEPSLAASLLLGAVLLGSLGRRGGAWSHLGSQRGGWE